MVISHFRSTNGRISPLTFLDLVSGELRRASKAAEYGTTFGAQLGKLRDHNGVMVSVKHHHRMHQIEYDITADHVGVL